MMENMSAKDAEIARLNLEVERASLQPSSGDGAVDIMRREFLDANIEILQGFVIGRASHERLLSFQRMLAFTSLHKLKVFFIEEYQRRLTDGSIEPAEKALAKLTPSAAPIEPLSPEQQAYKNELVAKIKELRGKLGTVRKEVNAVVERGDELIGKNPDYTLAYPSFISMGHRLCRIPPLWQKFPEAGLHYLLFKTRGPFITSSNNTLMNGLWTIEPYLMHKERAAKFEVLVFIGKETVILETS